MQPKCRLILADTIEWNDIDIIVRAKSQGFTLEGKSEGKIIVNENQVLPILFKLKANKLGTGQITIFAFLNGSPVGVITITPLVIEANLSEANERSTYQQPITQTVGHQPDLSLLILEHESNGLPAFEMLVSARDPSLGLCFKSFGHVQFMTNPKEFFKSFFKDIESLPLKTPEECAIAEQHLARKGAQLFSSLIPIELQQLFWQLRDKIETVQIFSQEPGFLGNYANSKAKRTA